MATCCENIVETPLEQSAALRARYVADGIVFPLRVMSAAEAGYYRQKCDDLEGGLGGKPRTVEVRQMHFHFEWAWRLATLPGVLDAVEHFLGPDLLITATELFAKHPTDGAVSIGWHRDGPYMGLDASRTLTAWIALTPSNRDNGCMRFVREADRRAGGVWPSRPRGEHGGASREPAIPDDQMHEVVLDAGEMSLHDVHVLHGSLPNRSPHKRVGFAIRFTTPEGKPALPRPPAILARGEDRFGHYELVQPPEGEDDQDALSGMRASARRHLEATLENLKHSRR